MYRFPGSGFFSAVQLFMSPTAGVTIMALVDPNTPLYWR